MSLMKSLLTGACLSALPLAALADPALIFDLGGKFDKSFNEAAYVGAERWKAETGGSYKELEMQSEAQREQALRRLAETGANPIVMTGFAFGEVLNQIAGDYPDTKFVIIDMVVEKPNVQSVIFSEPQGSYLAGVMAAMASKSGTVGFIGGMDVPLIHKFECGYAQGVKATKPDAKVLILERPGQGRRAGQGPDQPGRRRNLCGGGRHRHRRAAGGGGCEHPVDRRGQQPEPPASGQGADLDGQGRGQVGL